jgi:hypothetical protein
VHPFDIAQLPHLRRPHYFEGQLLTAATLQLEQDYLRAKSQLHNRLLHGWGVVDGLDVQSSAGTITVHPGVALDPAGNTIVLRNPRPLVVAPSTTAKAALFVVIRYAEQLVDPVNESASASDATGHRTVDEGAVCTAEPIATRPPDLGVTLARIIWRTTQWRVDARFRRRKAR